MTIKFVGDEPKAGVRFKSGLPTLDAALRDAQDNYGIPGDSIIELYGPKGAGKSSLSTDLAGEIAKQTGLGIDYLDIEGQGRNTIETILKNRGYDAPVHWTAMRQKETPEDTIIRWVDRCFEKDAGIGIFDALGAYTSSADLKGDIVDRNVGTKPIAMGNVVGRLVRALALSESHRVIFLLNHEHPTFGSRVAGSETTGGVKKKYLSHVRIRIQKMFMGKGWVEFPQGYLIKGKVENNRYGFDGELFYAFLMKGQGIHRGLTAMWECIVTKEASVSAEKLGLGTTVRMDGKSYGKLGEIMNNNLNDPDFFKPFYDKRSNLIEGLPEEEDTENATDE